MKSGILVFVYRSDGRTANPNGRLLTDRHGKLILILPEGGPFIPDAETPGVEIIYTQSGTYKHAVEIDKPHGFGTTAFGGNFIYTSDSRFPHDYPISVHDQNPVG